MRPEKFHMIIIVGREKSKFFGFGKKVVFGEPISVPGFTPYTFFKRAPSGTLEDVVVDKKTSTILLNDMGITRKEQGYIWNIVKLDDKKLYENIFAYTHSGKGPAKVDGKVVSQGKAVNLKEDSVIELMGHDLQFKIQIVRE